MNTGVSGAASFNSFSVGMRFSANLVLIPTDLVCAELAENAVFARRILDHLSAKVNRLLVDLEACTMHSTRGGIPDEVDERHRRASRL